MQHSEEMGEDRALKATEGLLCLSADGPSSCQRSSLSGWCQQHPLLAFRAACGRSAGYPAYRASLVVSLLRPQLRKQPPLKLLSTRACVCAKWLHLCLTLHNPMDCSLPGSSVHRILQARLLEWVAMLSSRGSSRPKDQTLVSYVSCFGRRVPYHRRHLGSPNRWCHLFSARTQRIFKRLMILKGYEHLYARGSV